MKPEQEKLEIDLKKLKEPPQDRLQKSYFELMQKGQSIQAIVGHFLQQGQLISFTQLCSLVEDLVHQGVIKNQSWQRAFEKSDSTNSKSKPPALRKPAWDDFTRWPFFRSLPDEWRRRFWDRSEVILCNAGQKFISSGATDRDLYVILEGSARIYRVQPPQGQSSGERRYIATATTGAILGEVAFLLGRPRTADVIMSGAGAVLKIPFDASEESFWKKDVASDRIHRFWALQAFLKSPILQHMPEGTLEECLGMGNIDPYPSNKVLWKEGDPGSSFSIIIQGSVVFDRGGKKINVLGQGEGFGEVSLFWGEGRRTAGATTQLETLLWTLDRDSFYLLLSRNLLLGREIEQLALQRIHRDHKRA